MTEQRERPDRSDDHAERVARAHPCAPIEREQRDAGQHETRRRDERHAARGGSPCPASARARAADRCRGRRRTDPARRSARRRPSPRARTPDESRREPPGRAHQSPTPRTANSAAAFGIIGRAAGWSLRNSGGVEDPSGQRARSERDQRRAAELRRAHERRRDPRLDVQRPRIRFPLGQLPALLCRSRSEACPECPDAAGFRRQSTPFRQTPDARVPPGCPSAQPAELTLEIGRRRR